MKKKVDMILRILGGVMLVLLCKLLIDFVVGLSEDVKVVLLILIGMSGVFLVSVKLVLSFIENNNRNKNEIEIQRVKRERYDNFITAFSAFAADMDAVDPAVKKDFYQEAGRLILYASQEVIECVEEIKLTHHIRIGELYELIRKDLETKNYQPPESLKASLKKIGAEWNK